MPPRFVNNRGFSLIEVIISLGVMSVIVLIFAFSIPLAKKAGNMNGQYAQAISLCQHKIDQMRAQGQGKLVSAELQPAEIIDYDKTTLPYKFTNVDSVREYLPDASTEIHIEPYFTYASASKVTVTIRWKNTTTQDKISTVSLTALITNVE